MTLTIHNPNPYPVVITDVTAGPGDVTASGGIGTCDVTGVSFNDQHGLDIHVPPNSDSDTVELNNAAHMSNESENGCQRSGVHDPGRPLGRQHRRGLPHLGEPPARRPTDSMTLNVAQMRSGAPRGAGPLALRRGVRR